MTPATTLYSPEQQEFLDMLRQASHAAKEMRAAMSAVSAQLEDLELEIA